MKTYTRNGLNIMTREFKLTMLTFFFITAKKSHIYVIRNTSLFYSLCSNFPLKLFACYTIDFHAIHLFLSRVFFFRHAYATVFRLSLSTYASHNVRLLSSTYTVHLKFTPYRAGSRQYRPYSKAALH